MTIVRGIRYVLRDNYVLEEVVFESQITKRHRPTFDPRILFVQSPNGRIYRKEKGYEPKPGETVFKPKLCDEIYIET